MNRTIMLRPAGPEDLGFAWSLYVATIKPYAAAFMAWNDNEQHDRFTRLWRPAQTDIITLDGVLDIGWMQTSEDAAEIVLQQFYVAPQYQGKGIGSQVLCMLIAAAPPDRPIRLEVLKNNPARSLYERFGFVVVGETAMKFTMVRPRTPTSQGADHGR